VDTVPPATVIARHAQLDKPVSGQFLFVQSGMDNFTDSPMPLCRNRLVDLLSPESSNIQVI
jgi:hypothetical protein